jgi:hypothetical protein
MGLCLFGQTDTIYFEKGKISCKIVEVSPAFITYHLAGYKSSPLFTIKQKFVSAYYISSDKTRMHLNHIEPVSRLDFTKNHHLILKCNPLSLFKHTIAFSAEQMITKKYVSLEVEAGYSNKKILPDVSNTDYYLNRYFNTASFSGGYIRTSLKLRLPNRPKKNVLTINYLRLDYLSAKKFFKEVGIINGARVPNPLRVELSTSAVIVCFGLEILNRNGLVVDLFFGPGIFHNKTQLYSAQHNITSTYSPLFIQQLNNTTLFSTEPLWKVSQTGLCYSGGVRIGFKINDK